MLDLQELKHRITCRYLELRNLCGLDHSRIK